MKKIPTPLEKKLIKASYLRDYFIRECGKPKLAIELYELKITQSGFGVLRTHPYANSVYHDWNLPRILGTNTVFYYGFQVMLVYPIEKGK